MPSTYVPPSAVQVSIENSSHAAVPKQQAAAQGLAPMIYCTVSNGEAPSTVSLVENCVVLSAPSEAFL